MDGQTSSQDRQALIDYIKLRLLVAGYEGDSTSSTNRLHVPFEVIAHLKERVRLSYGQHSPLEGRVQAFLDRYLTSGDIPAEAVRIPGLGQSFVLDREQMACELSLPEKGNKFSSDIVNSYRLINGQGVLHNPKSDRRTTQGVFHVSEGGMPIPEDKVAVPKSVYSKILQKALTPPKELMESPFVSDSVPFRSLFSLMIRPLVVPDVPGVLHEKRMEIQFLVPGNLVSNLDFIERIFGNAGDPYLPINDAGRDVVGWTGHTGYIVLAPHLTKLTKKDLGLPHYDEATDRQRRDGQCWKTESDLYNGGDAFKLTARDTSGVVVTIIADNYYGYCKKEVKTQISYAANLLGYAEEEHAGGALVYPEYDLGKYFTVPTHLPGAKHTFEEVVETLGDSVEALPGRYAVDRKYPDIFYVPEDVSIDIYKQTAEWSAEGRQHTIDIDPSQVYIVPSGFKVRLQQDIGSNEWRLVGTRAEATFCHKPSTVSGGGKSEISKPISDQIMYSPFFVNDFHKDMDAVEAILNADYSNRFCSGKRADSRPILSPERSLGSVIKLLTPSDKLYSNEYNAWLASIPHSIRQLVYVVKRYYRPELGTDWRDGFSVDIVNGRLGNELRFKDEKLMTYYMRVGFTTDSRWRIFSLRSDYVPAAKVQAEDDITASAVVPERLLADLNPRYSGPVSHKIVSSENPERRLFQRPDEAVHRGFDKQTEADFAKPGNFFSNFEPLRPEDARRLVSSPITFGEFTKPMQDVIRCAADSEGYFVSSAYPRLVGGKPSKNPRYLQIRPDIAHPRAKHIADIGARLYRKLKPGQALFNPVNAVLPGRRLNPPEPAAGIRSLAVYGPIHYQETPELFMENISSLTGKSPSTTGAGSEGALTKGPFNALPPIIDLNDALVSHILTDTHCFITAAGHVGPKLRVDHDISLLIPEIWSRMEVHERQVEYLIANNYLEQVTDFEYDGRNVLASRLGYRITSHFVSAYFGIVFDDPNGLFSDEMLRPELQDLDSYIDGIDNIVGTQKQIAKNYFDDGSIEFACPPLKGLLHIMLYGEYEGLKVSDAEFRTMFGLPALLESDWYAKRLETQASVDAKLWRNHAAYISSLLSDEIGDKAEKEVLLNKIGQCNQMLARIESQGYARKLTGYIGADPIVIA
jgi:phosphoenolpyruvate carboxykinase (diphosphate)